MNLEVVSIHWDDVYKDMARVPEQFRIDSRNRPIPEGAICKIRIGDRTALLSLRGQGEHNNPAIHLDEKTRAALNVRIGERPVVAFDQVGLIGQFFWALSASDPAYRIAARLGLVSIGLGVVGLALGIISIVK